MLLLTKQMAEHEGITEQLKAGSNAMGTTHEQHPGSGNGDRKSRPDLCIRYRVAGNNPCRLFTEMSCNVYLKNEQVKRPFIVTILSLRGIIMSLRKARGRI